MVLSFQVVRDRVRQDFRGVARIDLWDVAEPDQRVHAVHVAVNRRGPGLIDVGSRDRIGGAASRRARGVIEPAGVESRRGGEPAPRVTIIGTGLIGASIGLGIKAKGPAGLLVVGAEPFRDERIRHELSL